MRRVVACVRSPRHRGWRRTCLPSVPPRAWAHRARRQGASVRVGGVVALDFSSQSRRASFAERGLDLYETPSVAVAALLRVEQIPHTIWEPAAGRGAIVRVLRDRGHAVIASDVFDYGGLHFVRDFLGESKVPTGCSCIVTNPPFQIAQRFVAHALGVSPLVIMLLRLAFMGSRR